MQEVSSLDPRPGEAPRFTRAGNRWLQGNRSTRVYTEIVANDNGTITFEEKCRFTGTIFEQGIIEREKVA